VKFIYKVIASGFGTGFIPGAPGTYASLLAACLIYLFFYLTSSFHPGDASLLYILITLFFFFAGIISTRALQSEWGHDAPRFTIDEISGMFIAMILIDPIIENLIAALILFRFFDILKPFGIRLVEKIYGGWGVMLDDALAGIYSNLVLRTVLFFWIIG